MPRGRTGVAWPASLASPAHAVGNIRDRQAFDASEHHPGDAPGRGFRSPGDEPHRAPAFPSSGPNIVSTVRSKNRAIANASGSEGRYRRLSIEMIVWRDTPSAAALSLRHLPLDALLADLVSHDVKVPLHSPRCQGSFT